MLYVDDVVLGYVADDYVKQNEIPSTIEIQKTYTMQN